MMIFGYVAFILLILISLSVLYLYLLALAGLFGKKNYPKLVSKYDFLILVPSHNEELVIGHTLESLKKMTSIGRVEIAVIADNCTDSTAQIAGDMGVTVLERFDDVNKGKGFALEWAINQYNLDEFRAIAIVDADTLVENNMLEAMAQSLSLGYGAVQLYYGCSIEQKTGLSYLQKIANITENVFFYKARAVLGFPVLLRGTGMAIKAEVLKAHPWGSHSITEDVEYAVELLIDRIKIDFNTNSAVLAPATSSYEQSYSQKLRWAAGTFELIKNKTIPLLIKGIAQKRPDLIELGFSFILLSRPFLLYIAFIGMILGLLAGSAYRLLLFLWATVVIGLLLIYILGGILFIPEKKQALKALAQIPRYALWFLIVQIKALAKLGKLTWDRTERKVNDKT